MTASIPAPTHSLANNDWLPQQRPQLKILTQTLSIQPCGASKRTVPTSAFVSDFEFLPNQPTLESDQSSLLGRAAQHRFWCENGPKTVQNGRKPCFTYENSRINHEVSNKGPKLTINPPKTCSSAHIHTCQALVPGHNTQPSRTGESTPQRQGPLQARLSYHLTQQSRCPCSSGGAE